MMSSAKDELLDHPFLTENEIKSLLQDVAAMQHGEIKSIVNTDFWQRAMTEMTRRQAILQIRISESLSHATWALMFTTLLLSIVTFAVAICGH